MEDRRQASKHKGFKSYARLICNPKKKTFLGRTFKSWVLLLSFYAVFFAVLGALLYGMIYLSVFIIKNQGKPGIQHDGSPGMGYRPAIHLSSPLIWYEWKENGEVTYEDYVKDMKKFFEGYQEENANLDICKEKEPSGEKPCLFNISLLGPCGTPDYGYGNSTPCVYLKLNKMYGWEPDCYDSTSIPEEMPLDLHTIIQESSGNETEVVPKTVWVSCEGFNPMDQEHMGELQFYPKPGFDASFFPYKNKKDFMSPLIAVKFLNPMFGTVITMRCKAWAKNIETDASDVDFQLMIGFKGKTQDR